MSNEKILDRVRKLLSLSHSDNENEAAQAAARASALMAEHAITEAMVEVVRAGEDAPAHVAESIVDKTCTDDEKRVAWRQTIGYALALSLDCKGYTSGGNLHAVGRETAVATWGYVCAYLFAEVDRLCDEAWLREGADLVAVGQRPRAWKNAFRVGAATVIAHRLGEAKYAAEQARNVAARAAARGSLVAGTEAHQPEPTTSMVLHRAEQAIAVVDADRAQVVAHYEAFKKQNRLTKTRSIGSTTSRSGLTAGREAGRSVDLGGVSRPALGSGRGALPGGRR